MFEIFILLDEAPIKRINRGSTSDKRGRIYYEIPAMIKFKSPQFLFSLTNIISNEEDLSGLMMTNKNYLGLKW